MKIVEISKKLEEVISKNDLLELANPLKNEFAISKSSDLERTIENMKEGNRVLKVGIVGRVKAGKSSLLNALIFDGKNILPKAATPMTAALTKLEYSIETQASVEFYTQEDIDDLKEDFDRYNQLFSKVKQEEIRKQTERKKKKIFSGEKELDDKTKQEIQQKADKIANRELKKNDRLYASFDQYSRISQAKVSLKELEKYQTIKAKSIEELNGKLYDFVGADGKYMPFTKSVSIKLDNENLKDVEIIDTPGINDPITSREERTRQLLKDCDTILIVSPSGQFLSSEDIELLDRISTKEGIQEVYIIASQIDNQLYGSEKEENKGNLPNTLSSITLRLTEHLKSTISKQKELYPVQSKLFDEIMKNDVVFTSGATYGLLKSFEDKSKWDNNLNHVWNSLNENYKDYFNDKQSAKANLEKLSNISKVMSILKDVRTRKDEILKKREEEFEKLKLENINKFNQTLQKNISDDIQRIETIDLDDVKKQKENLLEIKERSSEALDLTYEDIVCEYEFNIKEILNNKVKSYFKQSKQEIKDSESTESESYTYDHGFWSFKFFSARYETRYRDINTIKAGAVRESLENLTYALEDLISDESKKSVLNFKKSLYNQLLGKLRETAGDENIDINLVQRSIRNILNSIDYPEISYSGTIPKELKKSGTLKNWEAENYMEKAKDYVSDFQKTVRRDIKIYVDSLITLLKDQNIANDIFASYTKDIEKLENDIRNKELSLSRNKFILEQLKGIK